MIPWTATTHYLYGETHARAVFAAAALRSDGFHVTVEAPLSQAEHVTYPVQVLHPTEPTSPRFASVVDRLKAIAAACDVEYDGWSIEGQGRDVTEMGVLLAAAEEAARGK